MVRLVISPCVELQLEFNANEMERFSDCKLSFLQNGVVETLCEDYLYYFIDGMLGRLKNIPILEDENRWGKIGQWQEYYYFEDDYNRKHAKKITMMERAIFISTENYGTFLYSFQNKIWLEINRGFFEGSEFSPMDYYSDPANYRVLLSEISAGAIKDWTEKLEDIKEGVVQFF